MSFAKEKSTQMLLVLANGVVFKGRGFGYNGKALGELCFNTSMSGYQEILSDPSYRKQIITFTYPMIGNYGITDEVSQAPSIQASGMIVKELVEHPSNHTSQKNLDTYLKEFQISGLQGIDTRRLVMILRKEGAQNGGLFPADTFSHEMLEEVQALPSMTGLDLASEAGTTFIYKYTNPKTTSKQKYKLAVLDFGIKKSILDLLYIQGFEITVFPPTSTYKQILEQNHGKSFDAYFLSNGPGDPSALLIAINTIKEIMQTKKPIFGICLGHQLLALALGYSSYKLKFGHRGGNQPVAQVSHLNKVEITSQNHGFAISKPANFSQSEPLFISHIHLNDNTISGFKSKETPWMSVQYHPEASPGPHDSRYLFQEFYELLEKFS